MSDYTCYDGRYTDFFCCQLDDEACDDVDGSDKCTLIREQEAAKPQMLECRSQYTFVTKTKQTKVTTQDRRSKIIIQKCDLICKVQAV